MFQKAIAIASEFTIPIILSRKTVGGQCSTNIGTAVVLNRDGWIATAGHIMHQWQKLVEAAAVTQASNTRIEKIRADKNLTNKERAKALSSGAQVGRDDTERCSIFVGIPNVKVTDFGFVPTETPGWGEVVDIGVARLDGFKPEQIKTYPVFKDPRKDFEPGRSLCKLGFPFHGVQSSWNAEKQSFELAKGALPMPRFPLEGMFTRTSEIIIEGADKPPYPIKYVETSTPGLKGQSGGPTFDVHGTIWAIQAKTSHLPLGFSGQNQFLNVGLGVHPDTMFPVFDQAGIKYEVSAY
jgi:hypothetical protein